MQITFGGTPSITPLHSDQTIPQSSPIAPRTVSKRNPYPLHSDQTNPQSSPAQSLYRLRIVIYGKVTGKNPQKHWSPGKCLNPAGFVSGARPFP